MAYMPDFPMRGAAAALVGRLRSALAVKAPFGATIGLWPNDLRELLDLADEAVLLKRVQERWPDGSLRVYWGREQEDGYVVCVIGDSGLEKLARGEGPTCAAALRQLLEGES